MSIVLASSRHRGLWFNVTRTAEAPQSFLHLLTEWLEHCLCGALSHSVESDSLAPRTVSPPGSSVHGILQVGIVEGVAIFPTQRLNSCLLCLLHWQSDSLPQSHLGSLAGALAVTKGNVLSIEATPGFFEVEIILELKGRREKWFCSLP